MENNAEPFRPRTKGQARSVFTLQNWLVFAPALLLAVAGCRSTTHKPPSFIYENPAEWVAEGDFDGDGLADVVIVDRRSGIYRVGYQRKDGTLEWLGAASSDLRYVTGLSVGRIYDAQKDDLLLSSGDAGGVCVVRVATGWRTNLAYEGIGPNTITALSLTNRPDALQRHFVVSSLYTLDLSPNKTELLRFSDPRLQTVHKLDLPEAPRRVQRLRFSPGGAEYFCALFSAANGTNFFMAHDFRRTPSLAVRVDGLPAGSDYVAGEFKGAGFLAFYRHGSPDITLRTVRESRKGLELGPPSRVTLEQPIQQLFSAGKYLLALHGARENPSLWAMDAPAPVRMPVDLHEYSISGAFGLGDRLGLLYRSLTRSGYSYSVRYELLKLDNRALTMNNSSPLPPLLPLDLPVATTIYQMIKEKETPIAAPEMKAYTNTIPGTDAQFAMMPIPGGEFMMGSPAAEKGRKPDEGPVHRVKIEPFWMGKCEVTWDEYTLYAYREYNRAAQSRVAERILKAADAVSAPSEKPYIEMSFGMGTHNFPAICMTPNAASLYCMWLSALTGEFYRLPTEAEWEYACRAGTTTAFSFGDDATKLHEYGWYEANSEVNGDWRYHKVGTRKPNPWGLYDMHGNVAEWCLDQYVPDYNQFAKGLSVAALVWPAKRYPRVVRGGAFDFEAAEARSTARMAGTLAWHDQDPRIPKNRWWVLDAKFVGFRVVRPLKVPSAQEMQRYWLSGQED